MCQPPRAPPGRRSAIRAQDGAAMRFSRRPARLGTGWFLLRKGSSGLPGPARESGPTHTQPNRFRRCGRRSTGWLPGPEVWKTSGARPSRVQSRVSGESGPSRRIRCVFRNERYTAPFRSANRRRPRPKFETGALSPKIERPLLPLPPGSSAVPQESAAALIRAGAEFGGPAGRQSRAPGGCREPLRIPGDFLRSAINRRGQGLLNYPVFAGDQVSGRTSRKHDRRCRPARSQRDCRCPRARRPCCRPKQPGCRVRRLARGTEWQA